MEINGKCGALWKNPRKGGTKLTTPRAMELSINFNIESRAVCCVQTKVVDGIYFVWEGGIVFGDKLLPKNVF